MIKNGKRILDGSRSEQEGDDCNKKRSVPIVQTL